MAAWILTILSLAGSYLNARKIRACFYLWIACNTGWMLWDIYTQVYSRAALDLVQSGFCVLGLYNWRKNDVTPGKFEDANPGGSSGAGQEGRNRVSS